jgi:hypothetical protein
MGANGTQAAANGSSHRSRVDTLTRLRLLVSYLGEKDQFDWWPTSFLSPTGRRFLEYNFPRTVLAAGAHSTTAAAKQLHDERIGRAGVYHLFRLPHALEQDIHRYLAAADGLAWAGLVESREVALESLKDMAGKESMSAQGPVRISGLSQMTHRPSTRKVASCYAQAFQTATRVYPYFTAESA